MKKRRGIPYAFGAALLLLASTQPGCWLRRSSILPECGAERQAAAWIHTDGELCGGRPSSA